jgi:hypothetical protein
LLLYLSRVEETSPKDGDGTSISQNEIHAPYDKIQALVDTGVIEATYTATSSEAEYKRKIGPSYVRKPYTHRYGTSVPVKFYKPGRKLESFPPISAVKPARKPKSFSSDDSFLESIQSPVISPITTVKNSENVFSDQKAFALNENQPTDQNEKIPPSYDPLFGKLQNNIKSHLRDASLGNPPDAEDPGSLTSFEENNNHDVWDKHVDQMPNVVDESNFLFASP